ncbi:MAG: transcriptional regulator [Pedobacter sp.]|nr:MAG: transcriptional regulator [Pedobacter sp.]
MRTIAAFIKNSRKKHGLTQEELAFKAGVGLRFLRELERGKTTVQLDKVNVVLNMFGKELGITDKQPENDQ